MPLPDNPYFCRLTTLVVFCVNKEGHMGARDLCSVGSTGDRSVCHPVEKARLENVRFIPFLVSSGVVSSPHGFGPGLVYIPGQILGSYHFKGSFVPWTGPYSAYSLECGKGDLAFSQDINEELPKAHKPLPRRSYGHRWLHFLYDIASKMFCLMGHQQFLNMFFV